MSDAKPMPVTLVKWTAMNRNTLRGFATVHFGALRIIDVAVHTKGDRQWAQLPAKPQVNTAEGTVRKSAEGKVLYVPVVEWTNRDASDRFSAGVIAAIQAEHPDDLT